jgi:hypothetical protein
VGLEVLRFSGFVGLWVSFSFLRLVWWFLCIFHVYLGASYTLF